QQVERSPLKESGDMRAPLAFLVGKLDFARDFKQFTHKRDGEDYLIKALPKSDKAPYTEVEFRISPKFEITFLKLSIYDGSTMTFRLGGLKLNPPIANELFVFHLPQGARVVEAADDGA